MGVRCSYKTLKQCTTRMCFEIFFINQIICLVLPVSTRIVNSFLDSLRCQGKLSIRTAKVCQCLLVKIISMEWLIIHGRLFHYFMSATNKTYKYVKNRKIVALPNSITETIKRLIIFYSDGICELAILKLGVCGCDWVRN